MSTIREQYQRFYYVSFIRNENERIEPKNWLIEKKKEFRLIYHVYETSQNY